MEQHASPRPPGSISDPGWSGRATRQRELASFLRDRRARIDPATAGIDPIPGPRRVTGLRREELSEAANLSIDYYTKLEQGRAGFASAQVRSGLAYALQLNISERRYLDLLLDPPTAPTPPLRPRPQLAELVRNFNPGLAYLLNYRLDIVAANPLAEKVLISGMRTDDRTNLARLVFSHDHGRRVYVDWWRKAEDISGILRFALAEYPQDQKLAGLVDDLMAVPDFAHLWRQVIVLDKNHGQRQLLFPDGQQVATDYETFRPVADPGFRLVISTPRENLVTPVDPALHSLNPQHDLVIRHPAGDGAPTVSTENGQAG
jgi:transcriptional regulator with XRE-family HTH domain